ncbi:MAG TPA: hypothetical protein VFZ57_07705 [Thermoanaerobaculia bacterium]|nr:hypothetical protein [Thermoanaerobaculia bacterium]
MNAIRPIWKEPSSFSEGAVLERLYRYLPDADFSRDVLDKRPETLAVLPVMGVSWDDLGDPGRVRTVRERNQVLRER